MPIKDIKSELCFDLPGGNTNNGTQLQLWWCNGTDAQDFSYDNSSKIIKHIPTGKCVDLSGNNRKDGTTIQLWDCNGSDAQKWDRHWTGGNPDNRIWGFQLANDTSKCIDAYGGRNSGSKLHIHTCATAVEGRGANQKFQPSMEGDWTPCVRNEDADQVGMSGGLYPRDRVGNQWCEKHNFKSWNMDNQDCGNWYYKFRCREQNPLSNEDKNACCESNLSRDKDYININGIEKKCPGEFKYADKEYCSNYFRNTCDSDNNIFTDRCQQLKNKNPTLYNQLMEKYCNKEEHVNKLQCKDWCNTNAERCTLQKRLGDCAIMGILKDKCNDKKVSELKSICESMGLWTPLGGLTGLAQCTETAISQMQKDCQTYNIKDNCTPVTIQAEKDRENFRLSQKEAADKIAQQKEAASKKYQDILENVINEDVSQNGTTTASFTVKPKIPIISLSEKPDYATAYDKILGIDRTTFIIIIVFIIIISMLSSSSIFLL